MYPDGEGDGVKVARTSTSIAELVVLWRTVFVNCFPCKIDQKVVGLVAARKRQCSVCVLSMTS